MICVVYVCININIKYQISISISISISTYIYIYNISYFLNPKWANLRVPRANRTSPAELAQVLLEVLFRRQPPGIPWRNHTGYIMIYHIEPQDKRAISQRMGVYSNTKVAILNDDSSNKPMNS